MSLLNTSENAQEKLEIGRLKKRPDFLHARNGARSHERAFVLQLGKRKTLDGQTASTPLRIGFTVTKKIGNAVVRNRIKRRFRAAVDSLSLSKADFATLYDCDCVMIARQEALSINFDTMAQDLHKGLLKALKKLNTPKGQSGRSVKKRSDVAK